MIESRIYFIVILFTCLFRSYENPQISDQRIEQGSRNFYEAIARTLKGKSSAPVDVYIDLDVQRWLWKDKGTPSQHKGYTLYENAGFCRLSLPRTWWYYLDKNGEGRAISFPIKMKPILSWTPKHFCFENGDLKQKARLPIEKLRVHIARQACCAETL